MDFDLGGARSPDFSRKISSCLVLAAALTVSSIEVAQGDEAVAAVKRTTFAAPPLGPTFAIGGRSGSEARYPTSPVIKPLPQQPPTPQATVAQTTQPRVERRRPPVQPAVEPLPAERLERRLPPPPVEAHPPRHTVRSLPPTEVNFWMASNVKPASDVSRVAFNLQDDAPPATDSAAAGDIGSSETELGSEPPSNELVFLRRQTVLLAAGSAQFDVGVVYAHLDDDRPIGLLDNNGDLVGIAEARTRQRLLIVPMEIRYGLTDRMQLYANMPVGYSNSEIGFNNFKQTDDDAGIGDLRTGVSTLLRQGECGSPDVILTLGGTAPTGEAETPLQGVIPNSQLGQGYWAVNANLLVIHTLDPCVLFYGAGYNHRFDETFDGIRVNPGEEINYQLGVGFAVNSHVTLSGSFQGAYLTEFAADGDRIEGSTVEPMAMRLAVTVAKGHKIVEPFASIPMTDDAPATIGVVWTY